MATDLYLRELFGNISADEDQIDDVAFTRMIDDLATSSGITSSSPALFCQSQVDEYQTSLKAATRIAHKDVSIPGSVASDTSPTTSSPLAEPSLPTSKRVTKKRAAITPASIAHTITTSGTVTSASKRGKKNESLPATSTLPLTDAVLKHVALNMKQQYRLSTCVQKRLWSVHERQSRMEEQLDRIENLLLRGGRLSFHHNTS